MLRSVKQLFIGSGKSISKAFRWMRSVPSRVFNVNFSHNTGKKMLSVALALLFWLFVMDQVDPEITRVFENVPVQLINLQELDQNNLKIMNQHDYLVNVEVMGRRNNVLNMTSSSIYLWADMRTVRSGNNNVYINRTINSEAVNIKGIFPNEILISAERIVSVPKPVTITFTDKFSESFYQERITISPEEIKVTGPESYVNSVSYLGASIAVGTLEDDLSREVTLLPYDSGGEVVNGVTLDLNYANVTISIGKIQNVQVNVDVDGVPMEGYRVVSVNIIPEQVVLTGPVDNIQNITTITAEGITLNGDEDTSIIVEKDLILPDGVALQSPVGPVQIEIEIEQIQSKEFVFNVIDLPIVNLNENFKVEIIDMESPINVKISDVESIITPLIKNDFQLDLNLSNVDKPGIYRLKVNFADLERFEEVVIEPVYVEVNVVEIEE